MTIPATAHFIWLGDRLAWLHAMAIRTAALNGGFTRVVLHHDRPLAHLPVWRELAGLPGFEARPLDAQAIFAGCGRHAERLGEVFAALDKPAARANVLRAAILHGEGGVYLDTDTVTTRPLDDLRCGLGAFCGEEHVVFPQHVVASGRPLPLAAALVRSALRDGLRRLPDGWRAFGAVAGLYQRAANNAVLGARPGHGLTERLLAGIAATPASRRRVRFALGTHLLQQVLADGREADLWVAPPPVFYPLGPEISTHWFRPTAEVRLDRMLAAETRVVHWYASVRCDALVPQIDRAWVVANAGTIPLAALLARTMDGVSQTTRVAMAGLAA
jgi:hypothetical protein